MEPTRADLHDVATLARVHRVVQTTDRGVRLILRGLSRVRLGDLVSREPYLRAAATPLPELGVNADTIPSRVAALRVCALAARAFATGSAPPEASRVARAIELPEALVLEVARDLDAGGVLRSVETEGEDLALVPARSPEEIRLTDVLDAVEGAPVRIEELTGASAAAGALVDLRAALEGSDANLDLATLAARD